MIRVIAFDLDDTLFDTLKQLTEKGDILIAKALEKQGFPEKWETIHKRRLALREEIGPHFHEITEAMCKEYSIVDEKTITKMHELARTVYSTLDVTGITLFSGARDMLERLHKKYVLVLVTSGIEEFQNKKIAELDIEDFFEFICVVDDVTMTKSSCLRQVLEMYHCAPSEVLVVGDRIDKELRAANEIGMVSVHMMHGKYIKLEPKDDLDKPDHKVEDILDTEKLAESIE